MMNEEGKYIYAIIKSKEPQVFGPLGIGGRGDKVYTVHHDGLAAVVSSSPMVEYRVRREHVMAHQKVLEQVMRQFALLPVRFSTIGEREEDIQDKLLKARLEEFQGLLEKMTDKVELGVRAFWTDVQEVFKEIVAENKDIAELKTKIEEQKSEQKAYGGKIKIGEMVKNALEEKKKKEAQALLESLQSLAEDYRENRILGDRNILNAAFLVKKEQEEEFDQKINKLEKELGERTRLNYFGPVPPYNFVEVVVTW